MPSRTWTVVVGAGVLAIVAYALLVAQQTLLGVLAASLFYLAAWLASRVAGASVDPGMSRARVAVAGALVLLSLAYALLVAQQVLLGLVVSVTVVVVAWATSPRSPVARALQ